MTLFLKKIGVLGFLICFLLFSITSINWAFINYSNFFELDTNVNVLILGDSHTKYAINDNKLPNTCNLSYDADSYFYSYLKLKELKKRNDQIDTLLLSFSKHNINKNIELLWILNRSHLRDRLKLYYPLIEAEDYNFLLNHKPKELFSNLFSQVLNPFYFLWKGQSIYGGYKPLGHNKLEKEIIKYNEKAETQDEDFEESTIEKKYLEKIRDFCGQNDIELIFINPPLHKTVNRKQTSLYAFYEHYFSDVLFLDYSQLEMPDDCYGDLVHLTPKGSNYFSSLLVKEGFLGLAKKVNAQ